MALRQMRMLFAVLWGKILVLCGIDTVNVCRGEKNPPVPKY